jgi:hypothetical protein
LSIKIGEANATDPLTAEPSCKDEARIGQKNKITRRWAKRGTRPSAPRDQRTASTYIFGAICPKQGNGAALILPACNTEAMNLHLAEIAKTLAPGSHAVLLVDQARFHLSARLLIPANIIILALPPNSLNSIPLKTSGSTCATTGSRTASSNPTTISSITVATLGIPCRPALENHVHRITPVGSWVLINEMWY